MNTEYKYNYTLLQYAHDPQLQERLNIGLVLYSSDAKKLLFQIDTHNKRLVTAFPTIQKTDFTRVRNYVRKRLENASKNNDDLFAQSNTSSVASSSFTVANSAFADLDSSFCWQKGGTGKTNNIEQTFDDLLNQFVRSNLDLHSTERRDDAKVWSSVSSVLTRSKVSKVLLGEQQITTPLSAHIDYPQSYQNGRLNVVKGLSFDLSSSEYIQGKAATWKSYAEWTARHAHAHLVIGKPQQSSLKREFENVVGLFRDIDAVDIYLEDEIGALELKIAQDSQIQLN